MKYLDKIIGIIAMAGLIILGIYLYEMGCQAVDSDQDCSQNILYHPKIISYIFNLLTSFGLFDNSIL